MNCMKCGREIKGEQGQVFCSKCLTDMERYPVKPNVTVQLPVRPVLPPEKKKNRRKKQPTAEEQLRRLRGAVRWLCLVLFVALVAFALVAAMLLQMLDARDRNNGQLGQNYRIVSVGDKN